MSDQLSASLPPDDPRIEALQAVVDRVTSWQETAEPQDIREELDKALATAGLDVDESVRDRIVEHIREDGSHASVRDILEG